MRKFVNTVLAGAIGLSMIAGVSAQNTATGDAHIEVGVNSTGGRSVQIQAAPNFGVVPYSLNPQTVTSLNAVDAEGVPTITDLVIVAIDDTGGVLGWNVVLTGEDFSTEGDPALSFPANSLTIGTGDNSTVANPGTGTVTLTPPTNLNEAGKIMSAPAEASSNGRYSSTFTGNQLTVPGGTLVGDYSSTLTVTIDAAP